MAADGKRVAIVAGLRTPFVKAGTGLSSLTAVELGATVVNELMQRTELDPTLVDHLVFGQVVPSRLSTLIGREVSLRSGLPPKVEAHTVSRACATGVQAIAEAASAILLGHSEVAIAGGAESLSDAPLFASRPLARALVEASRAKSTKDRLFAFRGLSLKDLPPIAPAIEEPTTGLTMGQSAEKMASENGVRREEQDKFAFESHQKAARAIAEGRLTDEVMTVRVPPRYETIVSTDNLVRPDTRLEALARLKPVFDKNYGTITAGNSSALTDGAACVLMMREDRARALGYEPLGFVKAWAFAALDPRGQLLMGPAYATPIALDRAGMSLDEMDLIEMHEAFAAQVLSNTQAFASRTFAKKQLGRDEAIGDIDPKKLNVNGGSLALGHPFGATGARLVTSCLRELARRGGQHGLVTMCAAGGLGAAMILERNPGFTLPT